MSTMTRNKIYSGRYVLCLSASVSLVILALAYGVNLFRIGPEGSVNDAMMGLGSLLQAIIVAIVTHYFTKSRDSLHTQG